MARLTREMRDQLEKEGHRIRTVEDWERVKDLHPEAIERYQDRRGDVDESDSVELED